MALERLGAQHMASVDKYAEPTTAAHQMTTRDYVVRVDAVDLASAVVVTLPPVSLAKGRYYTVMAKDATNTYTVTVQDFQSDGGLGDSESWQANVVFNEAGRGAVFYSDGQHWFFGSKTFTSVLTAGNVNLDECHLTVDTAGTQNIDACKCTLEIGVVVGTQAGAFMAKVDYDVGAARTTGLSYAIGAEMILPNIAAIASGHYTCVDHEMSAGALSTWGGGTLVSYMRFDNWGTEAQFDHTAYFFELCGAEAASHMVSENAYTIRVRISCSIEKERYLVMSHNENTCVLGTIAAPVPLTAGNALIKGMGDIQESTAAGGSVDNFYSHLYVSPGVAVTASAFPFAGHFRLEFQGGATTSCNSQSAAIRAYYMTDGAADVELDGSCTTIYAECRVGANTTFAATGYFAALAINSRTANAVVFTGEQQYWGIIMGRTGAGYQKFYAAMRLTDCTYFLDTKSDDVMANYDNAGVGGAKAGWLRLRFREQGVDRYIRLYATGV